jgi:hypothetical protein
MADDNWELLVYALAAISLAGFLTFACMIGP